MGRGRETKREYEIWWKSVPWVFVAICNSVRMQVCLHKSAELSACTRVCACVCVYAFVCASWEQPVKGGI